MVPHKDFVAEEDALSVTRIKDAGGVIVGKTNVPLGLGDWQSYNDVYGTTHNPYAATAPADALARCIPTSEYLH